MGSIARRNGEPRDSLCFIDQFTVMTHQLLRRISHLERHSRGICSYRETISRVTMAKDIIWPFNAASPSKRDGAADIAAPVKQVTALLRMRPQPVNEVRLDRHQSPGSRFCFVRGDGHEFALQVYGVPV